MIRQVFYIIIVFLMLPGCAIENEVVEREPQVVEDKIEEEKTQDKDPVVDNSVIDISKVDNEEKNTPEENIDELKAIGDAEELIDSIKEKNPERLIQLFNDSQMDEEMIKLIIQGFETNFDLDTLSAQLNYDGNGMHPDIGQYEFILLDNKTDHGNENMLVIRYVEEGHAIFHNAYIRYFPYAGKMVTRYFELIEEENAMGLARFLNPDDVEVPIWVAEETINNYKEFLEGESPLIHYSNRFHFVVEKGKNEHHLIEVIYGDGLMGIRDEFIPDF